MPPEVLSRRALNRALLQRQQLLSRAAPPAGGERPGPVLTMVEQLAGLQAQAPFPPYFGLWSRLDGFVPGDLAAMLLGRRVVRIALMRGTIHLVSARDCLAMRPLIQPVLDRGFRTGFARQLGGVDETQLADMGRTLVEEEPRTFSELGTLLAKRWPAASARRARPGGPRPGPAGPGAAACRLGAGRPGQAHLGRVVARRAAG